MKAKRTLIFLFCMYLSFWVGYFLRSVHYRQDLPQLEKVQAELRLDHQKIKGEFKPVIESAIKALQGYEEIIDRNRRYPVIPFVEPEEEL